MTVSDPLSALAALATAQDLLRQSNQDSLDADITAAIGLLGAAFDADRGYIFAVKDLALLRNTHEWARPGISPIRTDQKETPFAAADVFHTAFKRYGGLRLPSIDALAKGSDLHTILIQQQVQSLIAAPIWGRAEQIVGFVGLDFCRAQRAFLPEDMPVLQCFAASLGAALDLRRVARARDRMRADLEDANARLSAMINSLPELLVELDGDARIVGFTQNPSMVFAISPDEVIGRTPEETLPAYLAAICRKAMAQADLEGHSETFSYPLQIDGVEKRYTLQITARGAGPKTQLPGHIVVVRDITESYTQELQNRQLGRVAEISDSMILLTDRALRVTWVNPACIAYSGIPFAKAIGLRPSQVLHMEHLGSDEMAIIEHALDRGGAVKKEVTAISKSGAKYWIGLNIQPLRDHDGTIQGYVLVGNDITRHKLAELRAVQNSASAMVLSREGIAISREGGRVSFINPAMRAFLGISDDTKVDELTWNDVLPESLRQWFPEISRALQETGHWQGDIVLPCTDNTDRQFEVSISLQDDGSFLTIGRETTQQRASEKDLALLREQLQVAQNRQIVARIAEGLAHDLSNILAVIIQATEAIRFSDSSASASGLDHIDMATQEAQSLVRNMAQLGQRKRKREPLELQKIISNAADLVRPSFGADIQLTLKLPEQPCILICDRTEVMQVLINLMINARDALISGRSHSPRVRVELSGPVAPTLAEGSYIGEVQSGQEYLCVHIMDNGPGMDAHQQRQFLTPYFSTKGQDGIGLGMTIVADIVEANRGILKITSHPGAGTSIKTYWPLTDALNAEDFSENPRFLHGLRVLVVDADDETLQARSARLTAQGADVISCYSGEDALDALNEGASDWDMILIDDDTCPDVGLRIAACLKEIGQDLPLVITSSKDMLQFAKEYAEYPNMLVVSKQMGKGALFAAMKSSLSHFHNT